MLEKARSEMDYLALHNAYQPAVFDDGGNDVHTVYAAMLASPILIEKNLNTVSGQIETCGGGAGQPRSRSPSPSGVPIFHIDAKNK